MASVSGAHSSRSVIDVISQFPKSKVEVGSVRLRPILAAAVAAGGAYGPPIEEPSRFPKLEECAHFHYDNVELPPLKLSVVGCEEAGLQLRVAAASEWTLVRSYDHFVQLDEQLHKCVFARSFSRLPVLSRDVQPSQRPSLEMYVERLDWALRAGSCVSCGPVLTWLEADNRGRRMVASGHGINTPAVAAAFATAPYRAAAADELSFQTGDMISVIDMPPGEESAWWRGKRGFVVGFFPSHCVAVITGKIPPHLTIHEPTKPVLRKHGKLIAFFRAFILSRPSRRRLKQSGILKERVFGCDLSEHLLNSSRDIPLVLKCCAEFIESHGIVDGIYRLSGVSSNIQKLRATFDEDRAPGAMEEASIRQDIHSVASLLKMYFRELPNPLCTYQLYNEFVTAVQVPPEERLAAMSSVVAKLPPPHYRTLEYLVGHLWRVSEHAAATGMTARNVAIVWAPNLLRSRSLGVAALQGVGVQALVTEFLVVNAARIFGSDDPSLLQLEGEGAERPKSLAVSSPTRLLTLEEARARQSPGSKAEPLSTQTETLVTKVELTSNTGPIKYHTVLELPRKRQPLNWRTLFTPLRPSKGPKPVAAPPARKVVSVQSAEELTGLAGTIRPVGPVGSATHSRSVSHDSYFDTTASADQPSSSTTHPGMSMSLDLSELQMNFDMSESDMKLFSDEEDDTNAASSGSDAGLGGTLDLRYIDSCSPDPPAQSPHPATLGYMPLLTPSSCELGRSATSDLDPSPDPVTDRSSPITSPPQPGFHASMAEEDSLAEVGYEPLEAEAPRTPVDLVVSTENNLYESVDCRPYENDNVIAATNRPPENIYEDIQVSTAQDIYEQVSYLRNSVDEVNRLVVDKEEGKKGRVKAIMKKAQSLCEIENHLMGPQLPRAHSVDDQHVYEPVCSDGAKLAGPCVDAPYGTEYENINFAMPCAILARQRLHVDSHCCSHPKESLSQQEAEEIPKPEIPKIRNSDTMIEKNDRTPETTRDEIVVEAIVETSWGNSSPSRVDEQETKSDSINKSPESPKNSIILTEIPVNSCKHEFITRAVIEVPKTELVTPGDINESNSVISITKFVSDVPKPESVISKPDSKFQSHIPNLPKTESKVNSESWKAKDNLESFVNNESKCEQVPKSENFISFKSECVLNSSEALSESKSRPNNLGLTSRTVLELAPWSKSMPEKSEETAVNRSKEKGGKVTDGTATIPGTNPVVSVMSEVSRITAAMSAGDIRIQSPVGSPTRERAAFPETVHMPGTNEIFTQPAIVSLKQKSTSSVMSRSTEAVMQPAAVQGNSGLTKLTVVSKSTEAVTPKVTQRPSVLSWQMPNQSQRKTLEDNGKFSCVVVSEILKTGVMKTEESSESARGKTESLRMMFEHDAKKEEQPIKSPIKEKCDFFQSKEAEAGRGGKRNTGTRLNQNTTKTPLSNKVNQSPNKSSNNSPSKFTGSSNQSPRKLNDSSNRKDDKSGKFSNLPSKSGLVRSPSKGKDSPGKTREHTQQDSNREGSKTVESQTKPDRLEIRELSRSPGRVTRKFDPLALGPSSVSSTPGTTPSPESPPGPESDAERRERIERYKEERRNFFRNKYRLDNNNDDTMDQDLIRRIKQRTKNTKPPTPSATVP